MIYIKKRTTVPLTEADGSDSGAAFTAYERASFDVAQRAGLLFFQSNAQNGDVVASRTFLREAEEVLVAGSVTGFTGVFDETDGSSLPVEKWRELPPFYANQMLTWLLDRNIKETAQTAAELPNSNGGPPSDTSSPDAPEPSATTTTSEPSTSSSEPVSPS